MTPLTKTIWPGKNPQTDSWQQALKTIIREPAELFELLALNPKDMPNRLAACDDFALRVPRQFVAKMRPSDWNDPLLLQVLPQGQEVAAQPGFVNDPLQELQSNPLPGLIHKYHGRVLLIVSSGCAINCRYCFRRHFPYQDNNPSRDQWQQALHTIANDTSIHEVILSGGDPLVSTNKQLKELIDSIAAIAHVKTLRVHSRLPLVIPQRIDEGFIQAFTQNRLRQVFVTHCNHANELDQHTSEAFQRLKQAGVTLLNQSVLLADINDNQAALANLSETLFDQGVLPYYLHLLDKVKGAAHFDVTDTRAQQLIKQLLTQLPGYLVPKLVREVPKALSKVPV